MPTVKVSKHFQVTIPVAIRHQLGIDTGDELEAIPTGEGILYKLKNKGQSSQGDYNILARTHQ